MVRVRVVCVLTNSHVPLLLLLTPVLFQHEKWLISVSDFRQVRANSQLVLQQAVVGREKEAAIIRSREGFPRGLELSIPSPRYLVPLDRCASPCQQIKIKASSSPGTRRRSPAKRPRWSPMPSAAPSRASRRLKGEPMDQDDLVALPGTWIKSLAVATSKPGEMRSIAWRWRRSVLSGNQIQTDSTVLVVSMPGSH